MKMSNLLIVAQTASERSQDTNPGTVAYPASAESLYLFLPSSTGTTKRSCHNAQDSLSFFCGKKNQSLISIKSFSYKLFPPFNRIVDSYSEMTSK
jgi:hypothetical protein